MKVVERYWYYGAPENEDIFKVNDEGMYSEDELVVEPKRFKIPNDMVMYSFCERSKVLFYVSPGTTKTLRMIKFPFDGESNNSFWHEYFSFAEQVNRKNLCTPISISFSKRILYIDVQDEYTFVLLDGGNNRLSVLSFNTDRTFRSGKIKGCNECEMELDDFSDKISSFVVFQNLVGNFYVALTLKNKIYYFVYQFGSSNRSIELSSVAVDEDWPVCRIVKIKDSIGDNINMCGVVAYGENSEQICHLLAKDGEIEPDVHIFLDKKITKIHSIEHCTFWGYSNVYGDVKIMFLVILGDGCMYQYNMANDSLIRIAEDIFMCTEMKFLNNCFLGMKCDNFTWRLICSEPFLRAIDVQESRYKDYVNNVQSKDKKSHKISKLKNKAVPGISQKSNVEISDDDLLS